MYTIILHGGCPGTPYVIGTIDINNLLELEKKV